jgi:transaldolase
MTRTTPTRFWNDSCSIPELEYALGHGAVGATTNPVIVCEVIERERERYLSEIKALAAQHPGATEDELAWLLNESMAVAGAKLLEGIFEESGGREGYISIQTNPKFYRSAEKITEQALHFISLAKNIMVKIPAAKAGIAAIEEATRQGVNVNATVSFSVSQALAVGEAVERGLRWRGAFGLDDSGLRPVCTIMAGRLDDWLKETAEAQDIIVDPGALEMAGVAVVKRAYKIYKERGYRTRLLVAAYRNHMHWSEFIGGDISLTMPHKWIKRFINSDITVENRMDNPVDEGLIRQLRKHFPGFVKAYEPEGMYVSEFDSYGATRKTLAQFLNGYDKMVAIVRGCLNS